ALTREEEILRIYHNMLDEPMRQGFKNAFLISIIFAIAQSVIFLTNALAFWYGSRLIIVGEYDVKKMFTVFVAVIFGSMSAGRAFAFAPDIVKARCAAASIMSLIERVPTIDTWSNTVLNGIDLDINSGQYAALVGPSGCGKTTIISLIEQFYDIANGKVEIDGIDISALNVCNLRENIALVSQEPSLYDMTIKENVIFGCRPGQQATQEDVENACREANIHDFIIGLPDGYDTHVGGKGMQLSGGQKQRIAIARALIRNPRILLLDEATSALDSGSEIAVQKALDTAAAGRTTLAITHRLSTIQHVDVIFVIKDGKVYEQETYQELGSKDGGVDICVYISGIKFVVQCKNWIKEIGPSVVQSLDGALTQQPNGTVGVVVVPNEGEFTANCKERSRISIYHIILTNKNNICRDLEFVRKKCSNKDKILYV
ncbi:34067_t:CDS:2, partial [Gigaspora margarita]